LERLAGLAEMGVLLTEGGILYGGDDVHNTLDIIKQQYRNSSTGAASVGTGSGLPGSFYGLAPKSNPNIRDNTRARDVGHASGEISLMILLRRRLA
jgi:hypothetical protein